MPSVRVSSPTYGLPPYDAGVLVADKETADFFEACVAYGGTHTRCEDRRQLGQRRHRRLRERARPGRLRDAYHAGADCRPRRSHRQQDDLGKDCEGRARDHHRGRKDGDPKAIVACARHDAGDRYGCDRSAVDAIIAANPDKVEQAKAKPTMLGWFVGQVMKQTGGRANPQSVNEILKTKLGL